MSLSGSSRHTDRRLSMIFIGCVIGAAFPMCSVAGAEPFSFGAKSISVGVGLLSHSVLRRSKIGDLQDDVAVSLGISSPVGRWAMWGITGVISTPRDNVGGFFLVAAKIRLRFYPLLARPQRDQLYLTLGGTLFAIGVPYEARHGAGIELGCGLDMFVGQTTTTFVEGGIAVVGVSGWKEDDYRGDYALSLAATSTAGNETPLRVLLHVTLGTRFEI